MHRLTRLTAATALAAAAIAAVPAVAPAATTRTARTCLTRTTAVTGWQVYTVCLTATDSFDATHASGYVAGVSCQVHLPTGAGWSCGPFRAGSYWNAARGAWEDWLNYALVFRSPATSMQSCAYLRVDTRPGGATSYQQFITGPLAIGTAC